MTCLFVSAVESEQVPVLLFACSVFLSLLLMPSALV